MLMIRDSYAYDKIFFNMQDKKYKIKTLQTELGILV